MPVPPQYLVRVNWSQSPVPEVDTLRGMLRLEGEDWSVRIQLQRPLKEGVGWGTLAFLVEGPHINVLRETKTLPLYYGNVVVAQVEWRTDWIPYVLEATSKQDLIEALGEVMDDEMTPIPEDVLPGVPRPLRDTIRDGGVPAETRMVLLTHIKHFLLGVVLLYVHLRKIEHPLGDDMRSLYDEWDAVVKREIDWGPPDFREKRDAWLKESLENAGL